MVRDGILMTSRINLRMSASSSCHPYSPELNPIEQVWRWLRQRCLANQSFSDDDDIIDKICTAWNQFLHCTHRVKQMCSWEWIDLTS
ncbi:transposase [Photobacterium sp. 1_MG-2023]|uniref:transposase n=1 Tax=Photobacterium sp. 1_MG-2023 TaxID=3062646 RepID=UPI0034C5B55B